MKGTLFTIQVAETWRQMSAKDKQPYMLRVDTDEKRYQDQKLQVQRKGYYN